MARVTRWSEVVLIAALIGYAASATAQPVAQRGVRSQTITCSSNDHRRQTCRVGRWAGAELVRQISDTRCVRGRNWGFERDAVWVDNGCRGTFAQVQDGRYADDRYAHGTPWRPGPDWNRQISLSCASKSQHYQMCRVDVGRRGTVRLRRQDSNANCILNRTWGWNRAGVWVDNGCRGHFVVNRRW